MLIKPTLASASVCLLSFLSLLLLQTAPSLAYTKLSDDSLRGLKAPEENFDINNKETSLLAPILIPRVSGTVGNQEVQRFFLDFFSKQLPQWNVTTQTSKQKTPATGNEDVPFTNIIATREPEWARPGQTSYLTLAAHFDSKRTPKGFIGATDSAAPCAMILHVARELDGALSAYWDAKRAEDPDGLDDEALQGLQILLLDGEEAMVTWTHEDSLYGARALAEEWETTSYGVMGGRTDGGANRLGSISLMVLLDLLGAPQPAASVPSYFRTTHWAYQAMATAEERLRGLKLWTSASDQLFLKEKDKSESDPKARWLGGLIEDDHLPFMARGVEILHLIASPFPRVWHTMDDDGKHLDISTVQDWAKLVTAFTAEWMDLEGYMGKASAGRAEKATRRGASGDKSEL